jgi:flagellar protein FliS
MGLKTSAQEKYLETSIATASPEDLIIKTFDALVLFSSQALEKFKKDGHDIEGIHNKLLRAQRACCLLMGSLNFDVGGDLATNLFRVYEYWHHELVMANMKKDPSRIERLLPDFKSYRETWTEAISRFKAEQVLNGQAARSRSANTSTTVVSSFAAVG